MKYSFYFLICRKGRKNKNFTKEKRLSLSFRNALYLEILIVRFRSVAVDKRILCSVNFERIFRIKLDLTRYKVMKIL